MAPLICIWGFLAIPLIKAGVQGSVEYWGRSLSSLTCRLSEQKSIGFVTSEHLT